MNNGEIWLLYSAHDTEHNNAIALADSLQGKVQHARSA